MKNLKMYLLVLLLGVYLVSCEDNLIEGHGPIVTKELEINDFEKLIVAGSFDVEVYYGVIQSVVAVGQENIIDRLNMWVEDGKWVVKLEDGNYRNFDLNLRITVPYLSEAILKGSGNLDINSIQTSMLKAALIGSGNLRIDNFIGDLDQLNVVLEGSGLIAVNNLITDDVDVRIDGSGNVKLQGVGSDMDCRIIGSGNLKAINFLVQECQVDILGSGSTEVNVSSILSVDIDGSGNVRYIGNPIVYKVIEGSGSVVSIQ